VAGPDRRRLLILLGCLLIEMLGFGITLPVLPSSAERLAPRSQSPVGDVAAQVGPLTAVCPATQLILAPLRGHWSDSLVGRQLVLVGMAGAAVG
jgi:MFS family permease